VPWSVKKAGFHAMLFLKLKGAGLLFVSGENGGHGAGTVAPPVFSLSLLPVLTSGGESVEDQKAVKYLHSCCGGQGSEVHWERWWWSHRRRRGGGAAAPSPGAGGAGSPPLRGGGFEISSLLPSLLSGWGGRDLLI
jgi:hypothetical protein